MPRAPGDKNYDSRDKKFVAQIAALKAENSGLKAKHKAEIEAKNQRIKELWARASGKK